MKVLFKYWGLYVAVLCLYGTNLFYILIESDSLARICGLGLFYLLPMLIWVWALFQDKNLLLGKGNWFENSFEKSKVDFWTKVVIFCLGLYWCFSAAVPYLRGVVELINNGPIEVTAEILSLHAGVGAISNHLTLKSDTRYLSAKHFPRGTFKIGSTYKLLYIPYTQDVIAAELISTPEK